MVGGAGAYAVAAHECRDAGQLMAAGGRQKASFPYELCVHCQTARCPEHNRKYFSGHPRPTEDFSSTPRNSDLPSQLSMLKSLETDVECHWQPLVGLSVSHNC